MLHAVNQLRKEQGQSKITSEGLTSRAGAFKNYQETGYFSDSSEGEPFEDAIDHIVTLFPQHMSSEQKEIYAVEYEIEVEQVEEHWNSKHQKRVNYANRYAADVTFEDSPLEVLDRINQERRWIIPDMYKLDAKASIFDSVGEKKYFSSEDEREREEAIQQANTLPRSDILKPRNSKTWKEAQEYYRNRRGM